MDHTNSISNNETKLNDTSVKQDQDSSNNQQSKNIQNNCDGAKNIINSNVDILRLDKEKPVSVYNRLVTETFLSLPQAYEHSAKVNSIVSSSLQSITDGANCLCNMQSPCIFCDTCEPQLADISETDTTLSEDSPVCCCACAFKPELDIIVSQVFSKRLIIHVRRPVYPLTFKFTSDLDEFNCKFELDNSQLPCRCVAPDLELDIRCMEEQLYHLENFHCLTQPVNKYLTIIQKNEVLAKRCFLDTKVL